MIERATVTETKDVIGKEAAEKKEAAPEKEVVIENEAVSKGEAAAENRAMSEREAAIEKEKEIPLDQLETGCSGFIKTVGGKGALRRRLLDMGLTPGTQVMVRKVAPMGDPIELHLRSYELTIRREDAGRIQVEVAQ